MSKVGIHLSGINLDLYAINEFKKLLLEKGEAVIEIHESKGKEKLDVDITDMELADIEDEADWVVETAKAIKTYEHKRNNLIKRMGKKLKQTINRKNIN